MLDHEDRVRILGFRVRHDINQLVFSRGIISRNQLSNIENGKSSTTSKVLYQMYLRISEYMVVLNDYQRFAFKDIVEFQPYKDFNAVLDLYDRVCDENLDFETLNAINLELNHKHFGLFNTYILDEIGNCFMKNGDEENAFQFYMKAYYNLTSCNIDEITIGYVTKFIKEVTHMAFSMKCYFNTIEMLDHMMFLSEKLEIQQVNKDYMHTLAMSYKKLGFNEQAHNVCKKITEESKKGQAITISTLAATYHLMAVLQHEEGNSDSAQASFRKSSDIIRQHGIDAQHETLLIEAKSLGYAI